MYYGITIGPIVKTLGMTNTPAGLWTASYMFSYVAKALLKHLHDLNNVKLLLPYYNENYDSTEIGSYPDHIIFSGEMSDEEINTMITSAKNDLANVIHHSLYDTEIEAEKELVKDFIHSYVSIQCVKKEQVDENNVILEISELLDHLELSESFVQTDDKQFLSKLFSGDGNNADASKASRGYIKRFIRGICGNSNIRPQIQNDDTYKTLKDIESICEVESLSTRKLSDYYALIYADGDKMSSILKGLHGEELEKFSKTCLNFTQYASQEIKKYGGVTIYAGGDDLLFIAPLVGEVEKDQNDVKPEDKNKYEMNSIFKLCKNLSQKFKDMMRTEVTDKTTVSLSFGISIHFVRSPLYEAIIKARDMLFAHAKKLNDNKNAIAISLSKASGQSVSMVFSQEHELFDSWLKFLKKYYIDTKKNNGSRLSNQDDHVKNASEEDSVGKLPSISKDILDIEFINSVLYMMEDYYKLFELAATNGVIMNFFTNMTDNYHQKKYTDYIKEVAELYEKIKCAKSTSDFKTNDKKVKKDTSLSGVLRLSKFFVEKSGQDKKEK